MPLLFLLLLPTVCYADNTLQAAFESIVGEMNWPTPQSPRSESVASTFGPRLYRNGERYDFHRGVDIKGTVGDSILSSYDGNVVDIRYSTGGGNTITIEHHFPSTVIFQNQNITKWFSVYMHCNETMVIEGQSVNGGQTIGTVGETGAAETPHLHQEIRVGTRCSLEYAIENPNSTCNTLNFDPHIHPLFVYPGRSLDPPIVRLESDGASYIAILVSTPDSHPNVNTYTVTVSDTLSHVLDLNKRSGYNADNVAALDTPDQTVPFLEPISFSSAETEWNIRLIIPKSWSTSSDMDVSVTSIWGVSTIITVGNGAVAESDEDLTHGSILSHSLK